MKRKLFPITLLLAGVMMLASCLSDDDNSSNITYYGDGAITAFSLGTLNRYYLYNNGDTIKQTTDGADSTTTVDCSKYAMTIDQLNYALDKDGKPTKMHPIFNTDSLPAGTDIRKVVTSVSSKNSGIVTLLRLKKNATDKDTVDYYNSSDSIDFSTPREFRVFSTDGTYYRRYQVTLNVHKELPDSFVWHRQNVMNIIDGVKGAKLTEIINGNDTTLFMSLSDGIHSYIYSKKNFWNSKDNFEKLNGNGVFDANAYKNITTFNGWIYVMDGGHLYRSRNGENWFSVSASGVSFNSKSRLVGNSGKKMYAMTYGEEELKSEGHKKVMRALNLYSSVNGTDWERCDLNDDAVRLPGGNVSMCVIPSKTNSDIDRLLLMGNRMEGDTISTAGKVVIWGKIEDPKDDYYKWSLYENENKYQLNEMEGLSVIRYDGKLFAIGGSGLDGSIAKPFSKLFCSSDNGLTWKESKLFTLPSDLANAVDSNNISMIVDAKNHVWILNANTGTIWKMRINRLGWKKEQKSFNE